MKGRLIFKKPTKTYSDDPTLIKVYNKRKEHLGDISYYKKWKCCVWEQELCIMMSTNCLQEVIDYMKKKATNHDH